MFLFNVYSGQTIYYNKGLGISPSGYQWYTMIIVFGFSMKIINRTIHFS
jgi:hypothetical protein